MHNVFSIAPRDVVIADGRTVRATKMGDIRIICICRNRGDTLYRCNILKRALLVPEMNINLISCSKLCADGYELRFGRYGCSARKDGIIKMISYKMQGIYPVDVVVKQPSHHRCQAALSFSGDDEELWHARVGHANRDSVRKLLRSGAVQHIEGKFTNRAPTCPSCAKGKQSRCVRHRNPACATVVGDVVHSDVCGPMSCMSLGGSKYYVYFIDEFSGFMKTTPINATSAVAGEFRRYLSWFERKTDRRIKKLHSENGGENVALEGFLDERVIEVSRSSPYSPQENGIAERENRTIVESARAMLAHAGLPRRIWAEAVTHSADIRNRFLSPSSDNVTSYEILTGRKPRIDHFRVFGAHCWVHVPKEKRKKLDYKSEEGLLIECLENSVYKVWIRDRKEAVYCRDVRIDETSFPVREWFSTEDVSLLSGSNTVPPVTHTIVPTADGIAREELSRTEAAPFTDEEIDIITYVPEQPPSMSGTDQVQEVATQSQDHSEALDRRYPPRERSPPPDFFTPRQANVTCIFPQPEPHTITEALSSNDATKWKDAISSELLSLREHQTWRIVPKPKNNKVLPTRFVFKRKYNPAGSVSRHKARLVVKGFMQGQVLDTFAPGVDFNAVRIALSLAVQKGLHIRQLDIRTAFLHGDIDDDVYVSPPDGLPICGPTEALKLEKGLYELKQAPRLWNEKFKTTEQEIGFQSLRSDECVFVKKDIWLLLYVDETVVISASRESFTATKTALSSMLEVKDLGPLQHFLGVSFQRETDGAYLSQQGFISEILLRFGMKA